MPVPDSTPERVLTIRRGQIVYHVAESKYDTVLIQEDDGTTGTYKQLGFDIISMIVDGIEQPYVKREHVAAVPGRQDVAAGQVAILGDTDTPIPAVVQRAADGDDLPSPPAEDADNAPTGSRTRRTPQNT